MKRRHQEWLCDICYWCVWTVWTDLYDQYAAGEENISAGIGDLPIKKRGNFTRTRPKVVILIGVRFLGHKLRWSCRVTIEMSLRLPS